MTYGTVHRTLHRQISAALLMLVPIPAQAQQQDEQLWLQVNTSVPVTDDGRLAYRSSTSRIVSHTKCAMCPGGTKSCNEGGSNQP